MPDLNIGREKHSSCSFPNAMYALCGSILNNPQSVTISSIEKLENPSLPKIFMTPWKLI